MKIQTVINFLETIAPPIYQESYDNSGLIVGQAQAELQGVLLCLDSIEAVIEEAIEKNCNLIIAHHPIIFNGLKRLTGRTYIERVVAKAIKHDIAIYACHTNLDNVRHGVNAKIAEKLGLVNTKILAPKTKVLKKLSVFVPVNHADAVRVALFNAGAGQGEIHSDRSFNVVGAGTFKNSTSDEVAASQPTYQAEVKIEVVFPVEQQGAVLSVLHDNHPFEVTSYDLVTLENAHTSVGAGMIGELPDYMESTAFLNHLKTSMKVSSIRHTALSNSPIKRIAVCGGTGIFLLKKAIAQKADIFITADVKYHQFFDADGKIVIADIGHYESEQFTIDLFFEIISKKFSNLAIYRTSVNTNPVNYL